MLATMESTSKTSQRERLFSPIFLIIVAVMFFTFLVGQGVNSGTTVYLERVGGTATLAGIGAMAFSVAAAVMRLVCGPVVDARGRRIVMVAGALIMLAGTLGPLVVNEGAPFVVWRMLQGLGFSAASTAAATAVADVLPFSRLGEGIGYSGLGQALSMSIGPALAIFLVSTDPAENLYLGVTFCAAMALLLALFCRYEKHPQDLPPTSEYRVRWERGVVRTHAAEQTEPAHEELEVAAKAPASEAVAKSRWQAMARAVIEPTALGGTLVIFVMATAFAFNVFFMGSFGNSLHVANAGLYYTIAAIMMILVRLTSGRFMDKVAPVKLMAVAAASGILAFLLGAGCAQGLFGGATEMVFYAMGVPFGLCMGLGLPVNQAVAVKMTPPERWGAANAMVLLGLDLSNGAASIIWGLMIEHVGFLAALVGCVLMLALSFLLACALYPKEDT